MSITTSHEKLAEIIGAAVPADCGNRKRVFRGLEYDSRRIQGGELFIALKGEQAHGQLFLSQAFERGAALAVVEDSSLLASSPYAENLLQVPDSLRALWDLSRWWRRETKLPVLAVTGSVGKTTVKELCAAILLSAGPGTYAQKSFNNHVGVPYTVSQMHREHQWAVIEMGMNHAGEIADLTRIAEPNVAAITAIAPAHIEHFSGIDAIARAKLEIIEGLAPDGTLIMNDEADVLRSEWSKLSSRHKALFFGCSDQVDCQVKQIESQGLTGISFVLRLFSEEVPVRMSVMGRQYASNAACAALSCKTLLPFLELADIARALEAFRAPLMRLNQHELADGRIVIDDSYNANPASMSSMLELARDVVASGKRVVLVLGDMLEQGQFSEENHRRIGELAATVGAECVIAVGPAAKTFSDVCATLGTESYHTLDVACAAQNARAVAWDVVFVKGSRGIGLDRVVTALLAQAEKG